MHELVEVFTYKKNPEKTLEKPEQTGKQSRLWALCCENRALIELLHAYLHLVCVPETQTRGRMMLQEVQSEAENAAWFMIGLFAEYFGLFVEAPLTHYVCPQQPHDFSIQVSDMSPASEYTCMLCISATCGWNDVWFIRSFRQLESDGWEHKIKGPCEVNVLQDSVFTTCPQADTVEILLIQHCWIITQWINWIRCPYCRWRRKSFPPPHVFLWRSHSNSHLDTWDSAGNSHLTYCMWHHGVNEIRLVPQSLCTATFLFKPANWLPFVSFAFSPLPDRYNHTNTQKPGQNDPLMVWNTLSDWWTGHSSSRVQLL